MARRLLWVSQLMLLIVLDSLSGGDCDDDDLKILKVTALGQVGRLGELYDEKKKAFTQVSIFNQPVPAKLGHRFGTPFTTVSYDTTSTLVHKFKFLKLDAELATSFPAQGAQVGIGAKVSFLYSDRFTEQKAAAAISYETATSEDFVEIFYDEMKDRISKKRLEESTDTHVLIGIGWGASVICNFQSEKVDTENNLEIGAELRLSISKMMGSGATASKSKTFKGSPGESQGGVSVSLSAQINVDFSQKMRKAFSQYTFTLYGDVVLGNAPFPTDAIEIAKTLTRIPKMIKSSNKGAGKQAYFLLMPIERVRKFVNATAPPGARKAAPIPNGVGTLVIQTLDNILRIEKKIKQLRKLLLDNRDVVKATERARADKLLADHQILYAAFQRNITAEAITYRSGNGRSTLPLRNVLTESQDGKKGLKHIEDTLDNGFQDVKLKIEMVSLIVQEKAVWIGRRDHVWTVVIDTFLQRDFKVGNDKACMIHYYPSLLEMPVRLVALVRKAKQDGNLVFIVDCEFDHVSCFLMRNRDPSCQSIVPSDLIPEATTENVVKSTKGAVKTTKASYRQIGNDTSLEDLGVVTESE